MKRTKAGPSAHARAARVLEEYLAAHRRACSVAAHDALLRALQRRAPELGIDPTPSTLEHLLRKAVPDIKTSRQAVEKHLAGKCTCKKGRG